MKKCLASFGMDNLMANNMAVIKEDLYTRNILKKVRMLKEDIRKDSNAPIEVPNDVKFGQTVKALTDVIRQQLNSSNISFGDKPLLYYPNDKDLVMNFNIKDMNNMIVQFRLNDMNGQGCYISCDNMTLNDDNVKRIQGVKYAYDSWKETLIKDDSIIKELETSLGK